jgi:hypothetical protein
VTQEDQIREFTELLRTGKETFWQRLRAELDSRGIDPARTLLVESFEDDYRLEFGILISPDGRVIQYDYDFYSHGDIARGRFTRWDDLTERYEGLPWQAAIETALAMHGT